MKPTHDTYSQLDHAYQHFNKTLFGNRLPQCVITLHRKKGAYGYFWADTWSQRDGKQVTDEIALNPETFQDRSVTNVLSTLVHEMCHLEQHHFGKPSRSGYHNKEWAQMMEAVGLVPTDNGEIDGKRTGQRMTHYIAPGDRFEKACEKLLASGFTIPWQAITRDEETARKKAASKTRYSCPGCELNAWAKPGARLVCFDCEVELVAEGQE